MADKQIFELDAKTGTVLTNDVFPGTLYASGEAKKYTAQQIVFGSNTGTANQVLGLNSANTANEYKSIIAGNANITVANSAGAITISAVPLNNVPLGYFISAYSDQIQTNAGTTSENIMTYNNTVYNNGITITNSNQRITFSEPGTYNVQFSAQIDKTDSGNDDIDIWLKQNGNNVAESNTRVHVLENNGKFVAAWNWIVQTTTQNEYVQIAWSSADIDMRLYAEGTNTNPTRPAIPSVILSATQVMNVEYGTVTSVGLSLPSEFTVSNSPVTQSGTLTAVYASQTQNKFFASPDGSSGTPSFRAIVAADVPTLNQNTTGTAANVTGIVATANGGTGLNSIGTANQVLGVNTGATGLEYKSIAAGTGISVTPSAGSISIANTGVTSVSGAGTVNGLTLTGTVTTTGSLTLGGTLSNVNLASAVTGTLPATNGGTGLSALGTANQVLAINTGGSALVYKTLVAGGNINIVNSGTDITFSATGTGGDVVGPASSTNNYFSLFADSTGKLLKQGSGYIDSSAAQAKILDLEIQSNGTSTYNCFVGPNVFNSATGLHNTGFGNNTLTSVTTGNRNTAIGSSAGDSITASSDNVLVGYYTGQNLSVFGSYNVAVGSECMQNAIVNNYNVGVGYRALYNMTNGGDGNIGIGAESLYNITNVGNYNVAIGHQAATNANSDYGIHIGYRAAQNSTFYTDGIFIGKEAGKGHVSAEGCCLIGTETMYAASLPYCTVVGHKAMRNNTNGTSVTALGFEAGKNGTTGIGGCTFVGYQAGLNYNKLYGVHVGYRAGYNGAGGDFSTNVGGFAGSNVTSGANVTTVGGQAGINNTTGNYITCVGFAAGQTTQAGGTMTSFDNAICIGYDSRVSGSNQAQIGNSSTTLYAYAYATRSDERDKTDVKDVSLGLEFINKLKPIEYVYDYRDDYIELIPDEDDLEKKNKIVKKKKDGSKKRTRKHCGLSAQQVKRVLDELNTDFAGYIDGKVDGGDDVLSLRYNEFISPIIKAIQELSNENRQLKDRIADLEKKVK